MKIIYHLLETIYPSNHWLGEPNPSQEGLFNIINRLARGVAPAIVMSLRRPYFSWGHHFRWDCPLNGSQLHCHKGSSTGKLSYFSASAPRRYHFSPSHPFNWGHSCIVSQLNSHKGSSTDQFSYSSASDILATLAGAIPISL